MPTRARRDARDDDGDARDDARRTRSSDDARRMRVARRRLDEGAPAARTTAARVDAARRAIGRAIARALDQLGAFERGATKLVGFGAGWLAVRAPAAACGCAAGAYGGGLAACGACAIGAACVAARGPIRAVKDLVIGMALSVLPAALTATSALSAWRRGATTLDGERTNAMSADAASADAISVVGLARAHFRFDLMGEHHAALPAEDEKYMYKAGAEATGTVCAVPVTYDGWTRANAVPLWYVCDNDWAGHRDCTQAYEGDYDARRGWYGLRPLRKCLRAPLDALDAGATELHFLHLDFQQSFERKHALSEGALMRASVQHQVSIDLSAPRVYWNPIQEPCCAALAKEDDALLTAVTVLSVLPLAYLVYRDILEAWKKRINVESTKRAFYTRAELLGASRLSGASRRAPHSSTRRRS